MSAASLQNIRIDGATFRARDSHGNQELSSPNAETIPNFTQSHPSAAVLNDLKKPDTSHIAHVLDGVLTAHVSKATPQNSPANVEETAIPKITNIPARAALNPATSRWGQPIEEWHGPNRLETFLHDIKECNKGFGGFTTVIAGVGGIIWAASLSGGDQFNGSMFIELPLMCAAGGQLLIGILPPAVKAGYGIACQFFGKIGEKFDHL